MNIIYVTPLWSGVKNFFTEGNPEVSGMPAFYEVLIRLLRHEKVGKIYFITFSNDNHFIVPTEFKNKIEIIAFSNNIIFSSIRALIRIRNITSRRHISCIFGHGSIGAIAGIAGILFRVKCVRRIYGTFLINELSSSKLLLFLKHPLEYMSFSLKAEHIFITNDGTQGDKVYKKIGNKKLSPHFLINGINKTPQFEELNNIKLVTHSKYVTYIARIDRWKRQHLFVETIHLATLKGEQIPAYIIGQIYDQDYYYEIKELIKKYKLEKLITIIPGLPKNQINTIFHNSECSFSLYHTSNLGNVFLEGLSLGVPMIAFNVNNSLDYVDNDCYVCIEDGDVYTATEMLLEVWTNSDKRKEISKRAYSYADNNIITWEERAQLEIEVILN